MVQNYMNGSSSRSSLCRLRMNCMLAQRLKGRNFGGLQYMNKQLCRCISEQVLQTAQQKKSLDVCKVETVQQANQICDQVESLLNNSTTHDDVTFSVDTETSNLDVTSETPIDHGRMICLSLCCGDRPTFYHSNSSNKGSVVWVDTMNNQADGIIEVFANRFFSNSNVRKVFHHYSFDRHVINSASRQLGGQFSGFQMAGFAGDTMHMARLLNTGLRSYSLESLVDKYLWTEDDEKVSLKQLFEVPRGVLIPPTEEYQTDAGMRPKWVNYSALDAQLTWKLYSELKSRLQKTECFMDENICNCLQLDADNISMWDFYEMFYIPFGHLLTDIEDVGILVESQYLKKQQGKAEHEMECLSMGFRSWAAKRVPDAMHMNINSHDQRRQLFYGGQGMVAESRTFQIDNPEYFIWKEKQEKQVQQAEKEQAEIGSKKSKKPKVKKEKAPKRKREIVLSNLWALDGYTESPLDPSQNFTTEKQAPQVGQEVLEQFAGDSDSVLDALFILDPTNHLLVPMNNQIQFQNFENPDTLESKLLSISTNPNKQDFNQFLTDFSLDSDIIKYSKGNLSEIFEKALHKISKQTSLQNQQQQEIIQYCLLICQHLDLREQKLRREQSKWKKLLESNQDSDLSYNELKKLQKEYNFGSLFVHFRNLLEGVQACAATQCLLDYNSIAKLNSTYLSPLQEDEIRGNDGRVHCKLNINTDTGRLSCRNPNLQNQPAYEKDVKYQIRRAFVAKEGCKFVIADYGQLELRILAHVSNCQSMIELFESGGDLHSRTAYAMFDNVKQSVDSGECLLDHKVADGDDVNLKTVKQMFPIERQQAKTLNFSIAYGKTAQGLAEEWNISIAQAKKSLARWYEVRPEVEEWQEQQKEHVKEHGFIRTMLGRKRDIAGLKGVGLKKGGAFVLDQRRKAINSPVQGSAADLVMAAMLRIHTDQQLKTLGWKLVLQIHDEVILEGPEESAVEAQDIIVDCMERPFFDQRTQSYCNPLRASLSVDSRISDNWYKEG